MRAHALCARGRSGTEAVLTADRLASARRRLRRLRIFAIALSASGASGAAGPIAIAKSGAALVDLKPMTVVDCRADGGLHHSPYGVAAVPAAAAGAFGAFGGGVIVGDRGQTGSPVQVNAEGRQVRRLEKTVTGVQSLFVARGKLFALSSATVHVDDMATGQSLGVVETVGGDGRAVALQNPWSVLIVDGMMVVAERGAQAVSIWPLPRQFVE
jgi:hypothetical protein